MSLSLPQDPPIPASQPSLDSARQAQLPWRARISLLWQRGILTLRFWFRLPIDDIRDKQIENGFERLMENQRMLVKNLDKLIEVNNQMQARLSYYEQNIPRMRDLKGQLMREQAGLRPHSNGKIELLSP